MTFATAFAPAHLTLLFSVHRADDPRATGSRGAGLVVGDGAHVTVASGDGCRFNGAERTIEPVDDVLARLGVEASVAIESPLALGQGFGLSGAATLATALATNEAFELARSTNELVEAAHVAEVEAGTGLGDVVAQAHGGVPIRLAPGAPGPGRLDGIPARTDVEYLSLGEVDTRAVLAGSTESITAAGDRALDALLEEPTLRRLFDLGRAFSEEADLVDDELRAILEAVEAAGGKACIGHLGRTVVALGRGLTQAGYDPERTRVCPTGATLLPAP